MLQALLIAVVSAHLLAANVATGGPFVCLWAQWRAWRRRDAAAHALGRDLAGLSIYALAVTMVLGLTALGLVWHLRPEPFFSAAALVPASRYWFGAVELLFYLACMACYVRLWPPRGEMSSGRFWTMVVLALAGGTNLAYHFPPLFAVIGAWSRRPATWDGPPLRFVAAICDPEVAAMILHFLLASLAVTGTAVMLVAARKSWPGQAPEDLDRWTIRGAWLALAPTVLQLLAGMLVLAELPLGIRDALLGQDTLATALLGLGLLAAIGLLHRLAAVALGDTRPRQVFTSAAMMALVVLLMTAVLEAVR